MTSSKSLYSWDVQVTKFGDMLFINKRDDGSPSAENNILNYQTVNETASHEHQPLNDEESIQGVTKLMKEAAIINESIVI